MIARLTVVLCLALAASASALPGDPPVTATSPDDGASFPIGAAGVTVALGCPTFRDSDFGYPYTNYGYADSYAVTTSQSAATGSDGLLSQDTSETGVRQDADGACSVALTGLRTPGTYYWQPWRHCSGCDTGKEVGPVRSFRLVADPDSVKLAIRPPARAYAGFGTLVPITVAGADEKSPAVTLQRRTHGKWVKVPSVNALAFNDDQVATFPAGRYAVRAQLTLPQSGTVTSPQRTITVKRSRAGTPHADGTYADARYDLTAKVAKGGRRLQGFKATLTAACPIPAPGGGINLNPTPLSVAVPTTRIAPDGRFATSFPANGAKVGLSGRLHGGRLTGKVTGDSGPCTGTIRRFAARR